MQLALIALVSGRLLEGWNTNLPKDIPLLCFDHAGGEHCPPGGSEVSHILTDLFIGPLCPVHRALYTEIFYLSIKVITQKNFAPLWG